MTKEQTAQEIKETGRRLFQSRQFAEAIPLLRSAAEAYPQDEILWQELVLAATWTGQHDQAIEFAKLGIRRHPRSDWLWRQLGGELTKCDHLDEADKALSNSRNLNPKAEWLWRYYVELHRKRNNLEQEIEAWENLHALGVANANDLNLLGIAYYNQKNYAKSLEFYRLSAMAETNVSPLFNMGLVFNNPEVSQDSDAADAYRRALALQPNYEPAKKGLESTKQKLIPLAEGALAMTVGLVQSDDMFHFYVSPFEVLQIELVESVEDFVKGIQKAKKRLLQEIELNDGKVSWLSDYLLDKSRALAIIDELYDAKKRSYHWAIFQNKRLLRFMTRGDIGHFLYSDDYFPHETLDLLDRDTEFRAFLSKPFARQYNLVLTRAIDRRLLPIVEILFDGRRWVEQKDEDICFDGAYQRVHKLVDQIDDLAQRSNETKVTSAEIEGFLSQQTIPEIFNLLPTTFRGEQNRIVAAIREIAVNCHNKHDDSGESATILKLCGKFQFKGLDLNRRLEEDTKAIEDILREKEKQKIFAGLKPIDAAPSLSTTNGIGFTLYGHTGYDKATCSYIATYYFVFFGIPIFPIRRYRVSSIDRGYRFFGSLPLSAANKWHLFISLVFLFLCLPVYIFINNESGGGSHTPPSTYRDGTPAHSPPSTYRQPFAPDTSALESKTSYRIPSHMKAELDRDSNVIDREKAKAEEMARRLENLGLAIERSELYLNKNNQLDIDDYNRQVDTYNSLLEKQRAQNRLVNQLVENYNEKLRRNGR